MNECLGKIRRGKNHVGHFGQHTQKNIFREKNKQAYFFARSPHIIGK